MHKESKIIKVRTTTLDLIILLDVLNEDYIYCIDGITQYHRLKTSEKCESTLQYHDGLNTK